MTKVKKFIFIILILVNCFVLFAQENSKWTIGAVEFKYSQDIKRSEYEKALLKTVPKLILEQLYGTRERNIPDQEILDRKISTLIKDRNACFLELSKEQKTKDSLVIQNMSDYQFNKQSNACDKKIKEIQKKIDTKIDEQENLLNDFANKKGAFNSEENKFEDFVFYNGDSDNLFAFNEKTDTSDYSTFQCAKEVTSANINALITGSIITYADYAAISVEMFLYPLGKSTGVITEVGAISNIETISRNIAYRLAPKIENAIPCEVQIKITPTELKQEAKLRVDSTVYSPIPDKIIISKGVHNFCFECEGYKKETFSYGFGYEARYFLEVDFVESKPIETALVLKRAIPGNLFYNGQASSNNVMSVKINNAGVLGYYLTDNDNTLFFMIPKNQIQDNASVKVNLRDIDIGANIEKRRRMMYISYSALICSLPFMFYSYSNYMNFVRGYNGRVKDISLDDIKKYQTMSLVSIGLTASLGTWFVFELVNYLISANKALPAETRKSNIKFEDAVLDFETKKAEYEKKKEDALKQAELEKTENENLKTDNIEKENSENENTKIEKINKE